MTHEYGNWRGLLNLYVRARVFWVGVGLVDKVNNQRTPNVIIRTANTAPFVRHHNRVEKQYRTGQEVDQGNIRNLMYKRPTPGVPMISWL